MQLDYNISFEVCGVIISLIILYIVRTQYSTSERSTRLFLRMVWWVLAANILDIATTFTITYRVSVPPVINIVLNSLYFASMSMCVLAALAYITCSLNADSKLIKRGSIILMTVYDLLVLINIPTGILFRIDRTEYIHGALFLLCYACIGACGVLVLIELIRLRMKLTPRQKLASGGYLVMSVLFPLLHALVLKNVLLDYFGASLAALFMLFTLETPDFQELTHLQNNLREEVEHQTTLAVSGQKKVESMSRQVVEALIKTVDAKDEYTNGHSTRVSEYAELLARELGWPEDDVAALKYAALLHDIGKVGVPDAVLNKAGPLTDEEFAVIRQHPVIGADILKNVTALPWAEVVARYHHERYDGRGYPEKLSGEMIPREARLVCIADAYDAMSSSRVYRSNLSPQQIRRELKNGRGTQFDPEMLDAFMRLLDEDRLKIEHPYIRPDWMRKNDAARHEIDALTGVLYRDAGERLVRKCLPERKAYLLCVDVDNLKQYNAANGHPAGDKLLEELGAVLCETKIAGKIVYRYGGDEFVLYLPTDEESRAKALFRDIEVRFHGRCPRVTLSAGMCVLRPGDEYTEAFEKADKALYLVKMSGKADLRLYEEPGRQSAGDEGELEQIMRAARSGELSPVYDEIKRFEERNGPSRGNDRVVLVTLQEQVPMTVEDIEQATYCMDNAIRVLLRRSDLCMRYSNMQFILLLRGVNDAESRAVMDRIFSRFYREVGIKGIVPCYAVRPLREDTD